MTQLSVYEKSLLQTDAQLKQNTRRLLRQKALTSVDEILKLSLDGDRGINPRKLHPAMCIEEEIFASIRLNWLLLAANNVLLFKQIPWNASILLQVESQTEQQNNVSMQNFTNSPLMTNWADKFYFSPKTTENWKFEVNITRACTHLRKASSTSHSCTSALTQHHVQL